MLRSTALLAIRATSVLFIGANLLGSFYLRRTRKVRGRLRSLIRRIGLVLASLLLLVRERFALLDRDLVVAFGLRNRSVFLAFHRRLVGVSLGLCHVFRLVGLCFRHVSLRLRRILGLVAGAERRGE